MYPFGLMTGLYNHGNFFACVQCNFHGRMQDLRTIIHFQTHLVINFVLFFRFDFCVPTSDEKTPTENLGQVNNNNTEFKYL